LKTGITTFNTTKLRKVLLSNSLFRAGGVVVPLVVDIEALGGPAAHPAGELIDMSHTNIDDQHWKNEMFTASVIDHSGLFAN
jgi:hypothetical protein